LIAWFTLNDLSFSRKVSFDRLLIPLTMRLFFLFVLVLAYSGFGWGQACLATFTTTTVGCNEISFMPDADNANSYTWDFGDGETSTEENPTHIFFVDNPGPASFEVTLITGGGCVADTVTQTVNISVGTLPDPLIESDNIDDFTFCFSIDGEVFELIINNSSSTSSSNSMYIIDWGDGSPAFSGPNLPDGTSHTYTSVGLYEIELRVQSINGCWARKIQPFFYGSNPGGNIVPIINQIACVPGSIDFIISGTEDNLPSTTYRIWVDDGSGDTTYYNHPPPATYTYDISVSPCEDTDTLNNFYEIFFEPINPCFPQPGRTVIRANLAPVLDFSIEPEEACEGEVFVISNMSTPAQFVRVNSCSSEMTTTWEIIPNLPSSYTITSGSLSSEDGFSVVFNEPGEYDIRLIYETRVPSGCPSPPLTKPLCVIPVPDSEIAPDRTEGCTSEGSLLDVDFINASNTIGACGPASSYTWSVGFDPGECGASPSWTQVDRTPLDSLDNPNVNDQDIRLRFDSAGIYTVYLRVANECGVNTDSTIVTVSGAPKIDITPISDSCFVETFVVTPTLSFDADCFSPPTYEWAFPGGSPDSYTGEFPPAITYDEPGDYTISLTVENDCGETVVSERFELFPPPPIPNIQVTEEVCVGGTIEATNPLPPDPASNRYAWTGPNGFTSTEATWTISPATTANSGTYVLTVTDVNGCTATKDFIVNVTLSAPIQINPDPATVCLGEDLTLTASGGVTYSWAGDHLDGNSGPSVVFNHDVAGDYEVILIGSDPAGECDGTDTIIVTVFPFPIVEAGVPRLGCVGTDFNFQSGASPQITAGTTGSWSGDHITPEGTFNVDTPGEYTVTYSFSDGNGCSGPDEAIICIRDQPEAVFTLPVNVGCVADGLILRPENTSNTTDDCSPATYLWTVSYTGGACNTGTGASPFIEGTDSGSLNPVIELTESGEYTLTLVVSSECGSDTATETVTVGDRPSVTITEVTDKCGPQPVSFGADIIACDAEITSYAWDFPTADPPSTSDAATPPLISFPVGSHTVRLTVTNACGMTTITETFEVLEGPVINISLPQDSVCVGDQLMVMGNSTGSSLSFNWTASDPGITFNNTTSETPTINFAVPLGQYTVTLTVGNSVCDPVMTSFNVYVNDEPTVSLNPIGDGCGSLRGC
jgi:PKD repeat protein